MQPIVGLRIMVEKLTNKTASRSGTAKPPSHMYRLEELQQRFHISRAKAIRYLAALTHAAWNRAHDEKHG